jgi:hypothetical protein
MLAADMFLADQKPNPRKRTKCVLEGLFWSRSTIVGVGGSICILYLNVEQVAFSGNNQFLGDTKDRLKELLMVFQHSFI